VIRPTGISRQLPETESGLGVDLTVLLY
jgi:hypothetical protein